jgi:hypothetical protein
MAPISPAGQTLKKTPKRPIEKPLKCHIIAPERPI